MGRCRAHWNDLGVSLKKKQQKRRHGADVVLSPSVVEQINRLADNVALPKGKGFTRHNLRLKIEAMVRRSIADSGPDLPPDTFD